jgi:hypothetical protein
MVPSLPERVLIPNDLQLPANVETFMREVDLALAEAKPDRIVILKAGTADASYKRATARVGGETILRVCALGRGVPVAFLTRQKCASRLGVEGSLPDQVESVVAKSGRYWNEGRRLAVAAAVAESGARS